MSFRISNSLNNYHIFNRLNYPEHQQSPKNNDNITLVSAYYPIKSKHTIDNYLQWIDNFIKLSCNIVIFTSSEMLDFFHKYKDTKKNLNIINKEIDEFESSKWDEYWNYCYEVDYEKYHSPNLYKIWAEKTFFINQIANTNPFNSEFFFWVDIGCIRDSRYLDIIKDFPNIQKLNIFNPDKFFLSSIQDIMKEDENFTNGICNNIRLKHGKSVEIQRIQGGFMGGKKEAIQRWTQLYNSDIDLLKQEKEFAGKEQNVFLNIYLKNKEHFNLLTPTSYNIKYQSIFINFNNWFSFLYRFC